MLNRNLIALGLALCILLFSVTSCVVQPSHETSPETRIPQRAPVELAVLHESDLGPDWERSKHYEWPEERQVTEYFIKVPLQETPSWRMEEVVVCEIKVNPRIDDAFM